MEWDVYKTEFEKKASEKIEWLESRRPNGLRKTMS